MAPKKPAKPPPPPPKKAAPAKKPAARKKAAGVAVPVPTPTPRKRAPAAKKAGAKPKPKVKAKPAPKPRPKRAEPAGSTLTEKQQRFVDEYLVDLNATQAAIRAGYSVATAEQIAYQQLQKTSVQRAIHDGRKRQQERTEIKADRVVRELALVALADPRELVEHIVGCCRHCHGEGFKTQRTVAEMNHDREGWLDKGKPAHEFDEKGGIGFDPHKAPHPLCPECMGRGWGRTFLADTRRLSPAAVALYAGVKQTKEGLEVKMHSKLDAIEKLAKHLGMYEKDNEQKTDAHQITKQMTDAERAVRLLRVLKTNPGALASLLGGAAA